MATYFWSKDMRFVEELKYMVKSFILQRSLKNQQTNIFNKWLTPFHLNKPFS